MARPTKYTTEEERKEAKARKARERYAKHVGEVREYVVDPDAEKYRGTKAYRLYHGAKSRSKANNLPFDLDIVFVASLLEESKVCPLLEVEYDNGKYTQSLDKIIPELGYTKSNVWIVSRRANTIKNDASLEELTLLLSNFKRMLEEKKNF